MKDTPLPSHGCFLQQPVPLLAGRVRGNPSKTHFISVNSGGIEKHSLQMTQGITRSLGTLCQVLGTKENIYIFFFFLIFYVFKFIYLAALGFSCSTGDPFFPPASFSCGMLDL